MKRNKNLFLLACILVMAFLFTGCGSKAPGQRDDTANGGSYEKVELHNYGREVVIESMPQKVLTLGPNCSELFVALGLTDKIIGNSLDNHMGSPTGICS